MVDVWELLVWCCNFLRFKHRLHNRKQNSRLQELKISNRQELPSEISDFGKQSSFCDATNIEFVNAKHLIQIRQLVVRISNKALLWKIAGFWLLTRYHQPKLHSEPALAIMNQPWLKTPKTEWRVLAMDRAVAHFLVGGQSWARGCCCCCSWSQYSNDFNRRQLLRHELYVDLGRRTLFLTTGSHVRPSFLALEIRYLALLH